MSELQIGLLAVGVLVVVGVLAYNLLQERRARRSAEQAFRSSHADVLLDDGQPRKEPSFEASVRRSHPPEGGGLPDRRVDYVIDLSLGQPASATEVAAHWAAFEHRFAARALLAASADRASWRPLSAGGSCTAVQAALQLANRDGAVSETELIEFRAAADTLASHLAATVTAPEIRPALEAARELDQLCSEADIQVVLHVVPESGSAFPGESLSAPPGPFLLEYRAEGGYVLSLDVPRTPDMRRAYDAMVVYARDLCVRLGGRIVDDNAQALDERALAMIGAQLESVAGALQAKGIEPGGPAALRLFA